MVCRDLWVGMRILKCKGLAKREIEGKKYHDKNQELQPMTFKTKTKISTWVAFEINPFCRQAFVEGSVLEKF